MLLRKNMTEKYGQKMIFSYFFSVKMDVEYEKIALEKRGVNVSNINTADELYNNSFFDKIRENIEKKEKKQQEKPNLLPGGKCRKCGSMDTYYPPEEQTRRADEGMTSFRKCLNCGFNDRNI